MTEIEVEVQRIHEKYKARANQIAIKHTNNETDGEWLDDLTMDITEALLETRKETAQEPLFGYSNVEVEHMILFALAKGFEVEDPICH